LSVSKHEQIRPLLPFLLWVEDRHKECLLFSVRYSPYFILCTLFSVRGRA